MNKAKDAIIININCLNAKEITTGNDQFIKGQIVIANFISAITDIEKIELENMLNTKIEEIFKEQNSNNIDYMNYFKGGD